MSTAPLNVVATTGQSPAAGTAVDLGAVAPPASQVRPPVVLICEDPICLRDIVENLSKNAADDASILISNELQGIVRGDLGVDSRPVAELVSGLTEGQDPAKFAIVPVLLSQIAALPWKGEPLATKGKAEFVLVSRRDARDAAAAVYCGLGPEPDDIAWTALRATLTSVIERRVLLEELLGARGHGLLTLFAGDDLLPRSRGNAATAGLADLLTQTMRASEADAVGQSGAVARVSARFRSVLENFRRPPIRTQANVPDDEGDHRVAGILMVKDEEDIIFDNLCWHHAQGIRRFVILENGSTDGTRSEIDRFVRLAEPLGTKVLVLEDREVAYYQGHKTSMGAQIAYDYFGVEWAIAIDADEFWHSSYGSIPESIFRAEKFMENLVGFRRREPGFQIGLSVRYHNYYCTEKDDGGEPNPTRRLLYRERKVSGGKTATRWNPGSLFGQGNHIVASGTGGLTPTLNGARFGLGMRHYARRSFAQFVRKAMNGGRAYEATSLPQGYGSHWRNWFKLVQDGDQSAMRAEFNQKFVKPSAELTYDPLPRLDISENGIFVRKPVPVDAAPFNLPLNATPLVEVKGSTFSTASLALRAEPALAPVEMRTGTSDVSTFFQVFVRKEYDFDLGFAPKYIIDLGANIGLAAAYFAGRYLGCHVYCVEPNRQNFAVLERNIAALPNVAGICAAVWFERTTLQIVETDENGKDLGFWGTQTKPGTVRNESSATPAWTVLDIQSQAGFPWIDVLKVDIEGAEMELFENGSDIWLERTNCVIVETHDRFKPGTLRAVRNAMARHPFEETHSGENLVYRRVSALIGA